MAPSPMRETSRSPNFTCFKVGSFTLTLRTTPMQLPATRVREGLSFQVMPEPPNDRATQPYPWGAGEASTTPDRSTSDRSTVSTSPTAIRPGLSTTCFAPNTTPPCARR